MSITKTNLLILTEANIVFLLLRKLVRTVFFVSWRDSPLVGLGLLLIHEDFCGF